MLGRELINFIVENNLENEQVFENGKIVGFLTEDEAAKKFDVEVGTIHVWVNQGKMKGIRVNELVCVPFNSVDPRIDSLSFPFLKETKDNE